MKIKFVDGDSSEHVPSYIKSLVKVASTELLCRETKMPSTSDILWFRASPVAGRHAPLLSSALTPEAVALCSCAEPLVHFLVLFLLDPRVHLYPVLLSSKVARQKLNWVCLWFAYFIPYFTM